MKRMIHPIQTLWVFIILFAFVSCEEKEDAAPNSEKKEPSKIFYYQSQLVEDLDKAYPKSVYGFDSESTLYLKSWIIILDIASDDMGSGSKSIESRTKFDQFQIEPDNFDFEKVWIFSYKAITTVENILLNLKYRADSIKFDSPEDKVTYEGEARFLKAYYYFNLIRLFGDVVFNKDYYNNNEDNNIIDRTSVDSIYNNIIIDLQLAETLLTSKNRTARANPGTVQALLAKVYLTRAGMRFDAKVGTMSQGDASYWAMAAKWAEKCIYGNNYNLRDNYREVFPSHESEYHFEFNSEHIFYINCDGQDFHSESDFFETLLYFGPRLYNNEGAFSSFVGEVELSTSFAENDLRRETTLLTYVINDIGDTLYLDGRGADDFWPEMNIPHIGKYLPDEEKYEYPPKGNGTGTNYPLFRFAEVLLIYAEALNEANGGPDGESIEAFNRIRRRAGLDEWPNVKDLEGNIYPNTQDGFRRAIRQERRWELCFEGKRLFDLRRWGILVETFQARANAEDATEDDKIRSQNIQEYHNLFPLPQSEIDKHPNLSQNPGY